MAEPAAQLVTLALAIVDVAGVIGGSGEQIPTANAENNDARSDNKGAAALRYDLCHENVHSHGSQEAARGGA